jgi:hypothetical protein
MSWNTRFLTVVLLLGGAALFLQARAHNPIALERISLAAFPVQMSNWVGTDVPIPSETLKTLGAGEFLQREYINDQTEQPDVTLYLAYRPTDY